MAYKSLEEAIIYGHGVERSFICPVHDDHNASASVNVLKGLWVCYACRASGRAGEVEPDYENLLKQIDTMLAEINITYAETWWDIFDGAGPCEYWLGRFSADSCRRFRLGYDMRVDRPCYPLRDAGGNILGPVHRNLTEVGPKYFYPKDVQVSQLLFNASTEYHQVVTVVEGATDVIAADEIGVFAVGLLGSKLSPAKQRLIMRMNPGKLVIATDQDPAGNLAAEALMEWANAIGLPVIRAEWTGSKDLGEMTPTHRRIVLDPLVNVA